MRIDSGKFKGRKLLDSKYANIRPTTDKTRQALFVKLQFFLQDKLVLDLFCGTGALGIEALSRGAKDVIFVDKDWRSVSLTKENLKIVGQEAKVCKCDALTFLNACKMQFDLILIDPPYRCGLYEKVLKIVAEKNILAKDGLVVCEHLANEQPDFSPFVLQDQKRYGDTMLSYLTI